MRIWIIACAALLVGIIGGWAWTAAELGIHPGGSRIEWGTPSPTVAPPTPARPGEAPKLIVEQREFNFGSAELGAVGRHPFVFKNEGRGPLILTKGDTSCVCTLANIEKPEVPPGGSTTVEVEWHPKSHGPFRQSAQVLTNDPQHPRIELAIFGNVVSSYQLKPETLVFSALLANQSATSEAKVYSFATDNLAIIEPEWSDKSMAQFFELKTEPLTAEELKEEKGAKSGCSLKVTVKPGLPEGRFGERIRFHLNTPGDPQLELSIEGIITGPIGIEGRGWDSDRGMLMLEHVHSRDGAKAVLYLRIRGDAVKQANLRLDKIVPASLKVSVGKMEKLQPDLGRVPLTIEIPPGSQPEDHLGTELGPLARIYLDTGLAEPKQMRILVRYAVEE